MAAIDLGGIFGSENEPDENEADENEGGRPAAQSNQRSGISIPVALLLIVLAALTGGYAAIRVRRLWLRVVGWGRGMLGPPLGVRRAARARDKGQQARHDPGLASRVQRAADRHRPVARARPLLPPRAGPPREPPGGTTRRPAAGAPRRGSYRRPGLDSKARPDSPDHSELDQREFTTRSAYQAVERGC